MAGYLTTGVEWLSGPTFVSEWHSEKYGMRLYVMGDYHHRESECGARHPSYRVGDFLRDTVKDNPDRQIDLYVETSYLLKGIQETNPKKGRPTSYLDEVVEAFDKCFALDRSGCDYSNLQTHFLDFRLVYDNPAVFVLDLASDANTTEHEYIRLDPSTLEDTLKCVWATLENLKSLMAEPRATLLGVILKLYDRKDRIKHKRDSVQPDLRRLIDEYLETRIAEQRAQKRYGSFDLRTIYHELKEVYDYLQDDPIPIKRIDGLLRGFMFASNYALDMFVVYSLMSNPQNPVRAITYTGALHAQGLEEFLKEWLDFDLVARATETKTHPQCVNLANFDLPWFAD